ncbi:MAG: NHLP bacteriocin export ABC transporter permease/ATPase subunit [Planctomycetes bacterium]|nr:NHLP bacteriocin export ABC transporter permease/ATPase subunit [Planctomycetota bacterium]
MTTDDARSKLNTKVQIARRHQPFILDDPDKAWCILAGSADVFSSVVEEGVAVGTRRRLGHLGVGDAVFTVEDTQAQEPIRLMLLATADVELLAIPISRLDAASTETGKNPRELIESWVTKVGELLLWPKPPPTADRVDAPGQRKCEIGQSLRPARNHVSWVRIDAGSARFVGVSGLTMEPGQTYLPLADGLWFEAVEGLVVTTSDFDGLAFPHDHLAGLKMLHTYLAEHIRAADREDQADELRRLEQRVAIQRQGMRAAMDGLVSVLDKTPPTKERESAIENALALVAQSLGLSVATLPASAGARLRENPIATIARASRFRFRRVMLRGAWWQSDCGPLLAYTTEDRQPVALLPLKAGGYEIINPQDGVRARINKSWAEKLVPEAVMIYPRLPECLIRPVQLYRFLLRGRSADILLVVVLTLLATAFGMLTPLATAVVMDTAIPNADHRLLLELGLILLAATFGATVFELSRGILSIRMGVASDAVGRASLWDRLLNVRVSFFSRFSTGDLLSRVTAIGEVSQGLNYVIVQSILAALMSLLNFGLLAYFSLRLAMMAAALGVAVGIVTIAGGYFICKYTRRLIELRGTFFGLVVQMINAVNKIRVAGAQQRAFATWAKRYAGQLDLMRKIQAAEDYIAVLHQAVPTISAILLFWMGVELFSGGAQAGGSSLSIGIFLAFYTAMGTFLTGITSLSLSVVDFLDTMTRAERIAPILEGEQEVDESKVDPGELSGGMSLEHVDFRYVESGRKILDDLCIRIDPGEFVALVGPSGGGKSTILRLLLGFERIESGTIAFDGQDLSGLDTAAVRRQIGVVLQSGRITAGSVYENISVGARITLAEAWEAIKDAGLAEDIQAMPMGLHTIVSEGGTNFSGGQRQRLFVARALVSRPKILLMDEATSALDNRTQAIVSESLRRRNVTRVVVAHRMSTIRDADRIYVLDRGRVVETGSYDELLNKGGLFAAMMARQIA